MVILDYLKLMLQGGSMLSTQLLFDKPIPTKAMSTLIKTAELWEIR